MFCVFREFCGSKYLCKSVKSVGEYSLPICSVNSVKSVGEHYCSRVRGYGKDAIPSYNLWKPLLKKAQAFALLA